jgi:hypothetical protein
MRELSGIVACILEAPFDNGKCSAESLEAFVKGYQHKTDGTEVLSFDHADRLPQISMFVTWLFLK